MKTDKELDFLEEHIPELANSAIKKAYLDTLSAGLSVTKVIENKIYEIFPDGSKKFIKEIEASIENPQTYVDERARLALEASLTGADDSANELL